MQIQTSGPKYIANGNLTIQKIKLIQVNLNTAL